MSIAISVVIIKSYHQHIMALSMKPQARRRSSTQERKKNSQHHHIARQISTNREKSAGEFASHPDLYLFSYSFAFYHLYLGLLSSLTEFTTDQHHIFSTFVFGPTSGENTSYLALVRDRLFFACFFLPFSLVFFLSIFHGTSTSRDQ